MCFFIDHKRPHPRIAQKNIAIIKFYIISDNVEYDYASPCRYAATKKGLQEEVNLIPKEYTSMTTIEEGYHSYSIFKNTSVMKLKRTPLVKVRCWIPKGATYYYDPRYKEYVSSNLIVGDIIE